MKKYKNKYRISSARLKNWNYRNKSSYFITICTDQRKYFFGTIENGEMYLSKIGLLAHKFWEEIPQHFPHVKLGAFVIMPDHMHGVLTITDDVDDHVKTLQCNVFTSVMATISPKRGSISTIIRSYKSVTTKHARKINPKFGWQTRFHDWVIRNTAELNRIQEYIIENPIKWQIKNNQK